MSTANWRPLIAKVVREVWPQLQGGVDWIAAQVQTESGGNALALSPVGAVGLLQLMPATAEDLGVTDARDPEQNLRGGVRYLREQFEHLAEIPNDEDRLAWAFASYNAGRGYINKALKLARQDQEPFWWKWETGHYWLMHRDCFIVEGRYPDFRQVTDYVSRIRGARVTVAP